MFLIKTGLLGTTSRRTVHWYHLAEIERPDPGCCAVPGTAMEQFLPNNRLSPFEMAVFYTLC